MVGYAVLVLATLVAHFEIGVEIFSPRRLELRTSLQSVLYYYIHIGSIFLVAGILSSSIWAASSWGRYSGWDPKEVWSLIAFLAYMAILHARFDRMMGPFGVAAASILAFQTILMTYLGVNYVLAAGLYSYGFGGFRVVGSMIAVALAELAFLTVGWWAHQRNVAKGIVVPIP